MAENIVVLDYGSKTFKAGFAYSFPSEDEPRVVTPNAVEVHPTAAAPGEAPGPPLLDAHAEVHFPVHRGKIQDFDQFESLVHCILYELLGWEMGDEGNVIISEPLLTPRPDREHLTQLMFEVFNVNGLFIQDQPVLSLYAVAKQSGCVVDIGHGKVDISNVVEGQLSAASVRRAPFAGEDMTRLLEGMLSQQGIHIHSTHDVEVLKELCCRAADSAQDYDRAVATAGGSGGAASTSSSQQDRPGAELFKLPDGQEISIQHEGMHVAEALFRPSVMGADGPGIAEAAYECIISQYDASSRRAGCENLLLCGGGSSIPGLTARFLRDIRGLLPSSLQPSMCPVPEYMQQQQQQQQHHHHTCKYAPWIGGAVLAKVILQQNHFVSKGEYEEAGPYAIHKKCG